jgi:type II secretory pathway pseudopilin PulG
MNAMPMYPPLRSGYTLIQVMIVLVLIAIIGSITLPKISMSRYRADGAMRVVQSVLQQAERGAVQRQMEVIVSFDTAGQRVRLAYDANGNHLVDAGEEVHWKPLEEGSRFAVPSIGVNGAVGTSITGSNISKSAEGYPTIYYHRDGASSSSAEVYLRSSTSTDSNGFRALLVTQATGRVDLYRYGSGIWQRAGM